MGFIIFTFEQKSIYPVPHEYVDWSVKDVASWRDSGDSPYYLIAIEDTISMYLSGAAYADTGSPSLVKLAKRYGELLGRFVMVARNHNGELVEPVYSMEIETFLAGARLALSIVARGEIGAYIRFDSNNVSVGALNDVGEHD